MPRSHPIRLAALAVPFLLACSEQSPLDPNVPTRVAPTTRASSSLWATELTGTIANNGGYAIYVPTVWNGDVVFYSHGIVPPLAPVALPGPADWDGAAALRDALGQAGYAVAYSSYRENGYAIKDGAQRTHQLRGVFNSKVGKPRRSFLIGHSLGAQVAQVLAETYPGQYDGALAMCGVMGGTKLQTDYIAHTRTLFDFFYPGVLPGHTMEMPVTITNVTTQIQLPVINAVMGNQNAFALIAFADQVQLAGANPTELLTSLVNALAYQAIGVNDLLARTHGHTLFDNTTTIYTSSLLGSAPYAVVNPNVRRYSATADALEWLENNYEPTGNLQIPMITFHKTRDRLVPYRHEAAYATRVAAAGASGNLLQRSQNAFGHCDFGVTDVMQNFTDLVGWVNTGVKP